MGGKLAPIAPCTRHFPHVLIKLQVNARKSDWFTPLFAPVVIGRSNYFGIGFRPSFENPSILKVINKSRLA